MRVIVKLTLASIKMYLRQREVVVWAFAFPLLIVTLFSFVRFDGSSRISLGVVNGAGDTVAPLMRHLRDVKSLSIHEGSEPEERSALLKGERDLVLLLSPSMTPVSGGSVRVLADQAARPRETQLGILIVQRSLDELAFAQGGAARRTLVEPEAVISRNLTYVDFLLPGILSMTIMQLGVFGVAFGFVALKRRGVLRRMMATPLRRSDFILAQVITRVLVLVVQMAVMVLFGIFVLGLHFVGSLALLLAIGILGSSVFLSFGFMIAGVARTEDQVPPIANIVTLPMILLSGVFFNRALLPSLIRHITDYLPLTFLADGMRAVAIDGAGIAQTLPQIIGLGVWALLSAAAAVLLFRWE